MAIQHHHHDGDYVVTHYHEDVIDDGATPAAAFVAAFVSARHFPRSGASLGPVARFNRYQQHAAGITAISAATTRGAASGTAYSAVIAAARTDRTAACRLCRRPLTPLHKQPGGNHDSN